MPTELEELKQIHTELSEFAKGGIRLNAVIEKWPLLYKRKPESEHTGHPIPGVIAYAGGLLSESVPVIGEFETDGRPWLDAYGNPMVNSAGEPFRFLPGWKASACLVDESLDTSAEANRQKSKVTESLIILGRFLPPEASPLKLSGDSVGPWLLHLAEKCASGAAGKRYRTQWKQFGWTGNGNLVTMENTTENIVAEGPFAAMLNSLGDPPPQRIEIADVIGVSQVVLSDWIAEIKTKHKGQSPAIDITVADTMRRFAVAFTFPGEKRPYVERVDKALQKFLAPDRIFYDNRYEHELARTDLDTYLQKLYHDQTELIVVFLCSEYERKQWCRIEWRPVRDIIKQRRDGEVMPFRFDNANVPGLFSLDGYIDATTKTPEQAAELIHKRLLLNRGQTPSAAVTACEAPPAGIDPIVVSQATTDVIRFLSQEPGYEQESFTPPPAPPTELDRILNDPFFTGSRGHAQGSEQLNFSVQMPIPFTDDFWVKLELVAKAAENWNIPKQNPLFRLLRLRPASDQDKSLEENSDLLDQVKKLTEAVADEAFARSKL